MELGISREFASEKTQIPLLDQNLLIHRILVGGVGSAVLFLCRGPKHTCVPGAELRAFLSDTRLVPVHEAFTEKMSVQMDRRR